MVTRLTLRRVLLGRDVAIAYAAIIALYFVRSVRFQPLQIPAYLLVVAYDVVEVVLPILTPYHPIAFPVFLYLLAIVGAGVARLRSGDGEKGVMFQTVGGVCLVIGTISLLFGASVGGPLIAPADNPTPLAITTTTGVVLLVTGWWLLDQPSARGKSADSTE
ncbi:hypothetical protein [Halosolutus halophilus]|uniref:hypothetical protein n=1 Tax=Halosolutus halophilus TaxID=1552990 RepID=UPI0022352F89|nr:hypothetical protein [Halosolutus halophilus]